MNEQYSMIGEAPRAPYDTALLHPDGAFFVLLCLGSWALLLWLWAWNHKPRRTAKIYPRRTEWYLGNHDNRKN
jgi:hypothetical protein